MLAGWVGIALAVVLALLAALAIGDALAWFL